MNPLRAGIIGCGDFAQKHASIASGLPERVTLVAFCDRNEPRARATRDRHAPAANIYTDFSEMLAQETLGLLFICLPPYGHTNEVELAARYGTHFLIEKPIALSAEVAWRMVEIAEKAGLRTQVGFMNRFGAAVDRLHALQQSGEAGKTALFTARYFCNALHATWWRQREKSGGQLLEQVIHLLDLSRYIMGEPASVFCRQENLFHRGVDNYTSEDTSSTLIHFRNGGMAAISATNNAIPGKWISEYSVVTENITADFKSANEATLTFTKMSPSAVEAINSPLDHRRAQLLDLLDAIRDKRETRTPIREGAKSLDLALAAVRSATERREIDL